MPRQAIEIFYLLRYTDIIQQYHIGGISFMLAKKKAKDLVLDALFFIAGSFLFAVSIDTFTAPNQIAAGGLSRCGNDAQPSVRHPDWYCQYADERPAAHLGVH